jgi:hypothetical protein
MRNNTKSEIVLKFRHIDNAERMFKFLKKALSVGDMGGDLFLSYDGADKGTHTIGHDVKCDEIKHVIHKKCTHPIDKIKKISNNFNRCRLCGKEWK